MQVEDHPVDYARFEGVIPEGEYGGGTVMVWDLGTFKPENTDDVATCLRKGELKFSLNGKKLSGSWTLVRTQDRQAVAHLRAEYDPSEPRGLGLEDSVELVHPFFGEPLRREPHLRVRMVLV